MRQFPPEMIKYVRDWLADESDQFKQMSEKEQQEDVELCLSSIDGAMYNFKDGRYAF